MDYSLKKRLYNFVVNNNNNSEESNFLIKELKRELFYADINGQSIAVEDLEDYYAQDILRKKLGKKEDEEYTIDDCLKVADAYADEVSEEFSNQLDNTIRYSFD